MDMANKLAMHTFFRSIGTIFTYNYLCLLYSHTPWDNVIDELNIQLKKGTTSTKDYTKLQHTHEAALAATAVATNKTAY